jgi:LacI family transcriptional regulator
MTKITIKDIARQAGVSTSLVSFVMNGRGKEYRVSDHMITHIQTVARELNYQPNASARALRSGKTNTIGVIVSDISNPFFSEIVRCIEDLSFEKGWSVLFGSTDENPIKMARLVQAIQNKGVDGWIIVPCVGAEALLQELAQAREPIVILERNFPELNLPTVCLDNQAAAQMAVEHLLHNGYQNIQLLNYELPISSLQERERAYVQSMTLHGLRDRVQVHRLPFKLPIGTNKAQYIESMMPILGSAEALICVTARLSLMSIKAFQTAGVRMPQDIGFVGFDANDTFDLIGTSITHIKQQPQEFGIRAFEMLSILLESKTLETTLVLLTSELIPGESSLPRGEKSGIQGFDLKEKFVQSMKKRNI